MKVKVIDSMTGSGKTVAMINHMNRSGDDERFFFVTPYLTEIQRVRQCCPDKHFHEPHQYQTKLNGLKMLLREGRNIVTTHALFDYLDDDACELIKKAGYTLVMDEVHDVVAKYYISKHDADAILNNFVEVGDGGVLTWTADDYEGRFEDCRRLIEEGRINAPNHKTLVWHFPVSIFECFKEVIIMTYMFDAQVQRAYFDYYGVEYEPLYIKGDSYETYEISEVPVEREKVNYKKLIHLCRSRRLNGIGSPTYALSQNWFERNARNPEGIPRLRKNIYTFFRRTANAASKECLWTTFSRFRSTTSGAGYVRGFLSCNARATNQWKDRRAVAYAANRFIDPNVKTFFYKKGIKLDDDGFALSELIQFVWRSAIRDGKEIWLYIPSRRMRRLFEAWLEKGV